MATNKESESRKTAKVDWESIEPDWRAGVKTKKMISEEYGVSRAAMDKHFGKLGIDRDLNAQIQARAEAKVIRQAVAPKVTQKVTQGKVTPDEVTQKRLDVTEDAIVEANADFVANKVNLQRAVVGEAVDLSVSLIREVAALTANLDAINDLGEMMYSPDDKGVDKLNDLYRKVTSMAGRVDSGKKAIESLKVAVELQRKVLRIKDDPEPTATVVLKADQNLSPAEAYLRMLGKK